MSDRTAHLNKKVKDVDVPDMLEPVVGDMKSAPLLVQWTTM